jgi:hypothetical protein
MADLAVRTQVIGADQIAGVDLGAVDELVDLDGPRRFQRNVLEFFLGHLDEGVGVDLVALDDVLVGHLLAGVRVDLGVLDAVAGLAVELVERVWSMAQSSPSPRRPLTLEEAPGSIGC